MKLMELKSLLFICFLVRWSSRYFFKIIETTPSGIECRIHLAISIEDDKYERNILVA